MRRGIGRGLPACLAVLAVWAATLRGAEERPNVVFIISDDLGAQALGCYGNTDCATPHIDALAAAGARFTRAYAQSPVCGSSRAALMSGLYPQTLGITSNDGSRAITKKLGTRPSLPQHFLEHGYHAARVSKVFHMRVPGDITAGADGFDHAPSWTERFNILAPEQWTEGEDLLLTSKRVKPDPQRDVHYALGYSDAFYVVRGEGDGTEQADHQAATRAVDLLRQRAEDGRPFFLAVGLVRPHVPLVAPRSSFATYEDQVLSLPPVVEDDWVDIPRSGISKNGPAIGLTTRSKQRQVLEAYYAAVSFMDAQVGRIVAAVDDLGLRDETIVVFTSDHGYHLGEHDFWQKQSLHEEATRIPLVIDVPGTAPGMPAGLSQQIDLYPTLAELCGLPVPDHVQGASLVPLLEDPEAVVHEAVYALRDRDDHLLRTDRWAYIRYGRGGAELYDMLSDPHQFRNLADAPAFGRIRDELQAQLEARLDGMD